MIYQYHSSANEIDEKSSAAFDLDLFECRAIVR